MAVAQVVTSSLYTSISGNPFSSHSLSPSRIGVTTFPPFRTAFTSGSQLLISRSCSQPKLAYKSRSVSIKCEQSTKGNGVDVWLGRVAMVGFAVGISVEIATGKGLLENFGLTTPLPTAALALTGVVGVLTAIFIFQSASEN